MKSINVGAGILEMVLGQGLRVLCGTYVENCSEGEMLRLVETNGDEDTGRRFFARVMHAVDDCVIQIDLAPFMEQQNEDDPKKFDRLPMAGEFANEKYNIPLEAENGWVADTKGEKPLWIYKGAKWLAEYSISKLIFSQAALNIFKENKSTTPDIVVIRLQGIGGETEHRYELIAPVSQ